MHFLFGLSSTDLLWDVDAKRDIQTASISSYLTLASLGADARATCCIAEAGVIVRPSLLGKVFLLRRITYILLLLYALICAYPNFYDVCDSNCVVMVIVVAFGSHSLLRIPRASRSPRRSLGLAKRFSSYHFPYEH